MSWQRTTARLMSNNVPHPPTGLGNNNLLVTDGLPTQTDREPLVFRVSPDLG